jgi:hypothetical protein
MIVTAILAAVEVAAAVTRTPATTALVVER